MMYQCQACTYKGKHFPGGVCPGCGSAHIEKIAGQDDQQPVARKPYRLVLAAALWLYLIIEIYRKLV